MDDVIAETAEQVREACAHGRALVRQRREEGESEALDGAIALALRGAFLYFDVLVTLLPVEPGRRPLPPRV